MKTNNIFIQLTFLLILILTCCKVSLKADGEQLYPYKKLKGYIQTNQNWKNSPKFRILFQGKQLVSDENGFYAFPLDKNKNKLHFLICKNVKPIIQKTNTIKGLNLFEKKPYKFFSFTKTGTTNSWQQKKETLKTKIPKDSIIVLINPKYIETVEPWKIKLNNNFIALPKIKIKENILETKLLHETTKSLIRSLDLMIFHEKVSTIRKKYDNKKEAIIIQ